MLTWCLDYRRTAEEQAAAPAANPGECSASSGKQPTKLGCARCKFVYYCDKDCQTNHWNTHKTHMQSDRSSAAFFGQFRHQGWTYNRHGGNEKWKVDLRLEVMNDARSV